MQKQKSAGLKIHTQVQIVQFLILLIRLVMSAFFKTWNKRSTVRELNLSSFNFPQDRHYVVFALIFLIFLPSLCSKANPSATVTVPSPWQPPLPNAVIGCCEILAWLHVQIKGGGWLTASESPLSVHIGVSLCKKSPLPNVSRLKMNVGGLNFHRRNACYSHGLQRAFVSATRGQKRKACWHHWRDCWWAKNNDRTHIYGSNCGLHTSFPGIFGSLTFTYFRMTGSDR